MIKWCICQIFSRDWFILSPSWMMLQWFDKFINKITSSLSYIYIIHHPFCNYYDIHISKQTKKQQKTYIVYFIYLQSTIFVLYSVWCLYTIWLLTKLTLSLFYLPTYLSCFSIDSYILSIYTKTIKYPTDCPIYLIKWPFFRTLEKYLKYWYF